MTWLVGREKLKNCWLQWGNFVKKGTKRTRVAVKIANSNEKSLSCVTTYE